MLFYASFQRLSSMNIRNISEIKMIVGCLVVAVQWHALTLKKGN